MHFAFAITEYFPFGGAQREFFSIVTAMANRGHQISVITTGWQGEKSPDWHYYILEQKTQTNHGRMQELSDYVINLKQQHHFDAVVGFTRMIGLDVYYCVDNSFVATRYKGLKRLLPRYRTYANIERTVFSKGDLKTFFMTERQRVQYQSCFNLNMNESVILPVCVDKSFQYTEQKWHAAQQWRQTQPGSLANVVLLFVAADFKTKGLDRIIDAIEHLDKEDRAKFTLWIVGEGKAEKYQQDLERLPEIEFKFWGGKTNLAQFYLAADYLIHPARIESAGMVIAEAMASNLPIYVTDVCGYSFLANDDPESVILRDENVVTELSESLRKIAKTPVVPDRGSGSSQVLYLSRAEFCADQLEQWYE
jgi:UDP-glucose:(heptosyl)LPS alpha-1,3-glucosyltransferase